MRKKERISYIRYDKKQNCDYPGLKRPEEIERQKHKRTVGDAADCVYDGLMDYGAMRIKYRQLEME